MSWIAASVAALKVGSGIYGAISANQTQQRNKGYINDAYRTASTRMTTQQNEGAEGNLEALNQRGLVGGGIGPIHAAMTNGSTPGATDLAGSSASKLAGEYALDRHALDAAHTQALHENKADALNSEIGSISSGIQGAVGAVGTHEDLTAMQSMNGGSHPIASALLSSSSFDGVHPVDPLGDPSSAWHMPQGGTTLGIGQSNAAFNTGVG